MTIKQVDLYDSTYAKFQAVIQRKVREETFLEDVGQNSWVTADEYRRFSERLELQPSHHVLDVASGSGGPAIFMVRTTGCRMTGVDLNEHAIATANQAAADAGLSGRMTFVHANASDALPLDDSTFDAIVCIDAIHHFLDRAKVLRDWLRVLRPGGRVIYTDPVILTGIVTNEEIALRASIGYFQFSPPGTDEHLIREAGLELLGCEDVTENAAVIAKRWLDARAKYRTEMIQFEGEERFEGLQRFFDVVYRVSAERRLARYAFFMRKPD
jgi:SAM-dependent methyltransferase